MSRTGAAPVIRCHENTARALGAKRLRAGAQPGRFSRYCIRFETGDGSLWLWPIERGLLAAILNFRGQRR